MFNLENDTFVYLSLIIAGFSMIFYAVDKFSMAFKSIVILTFLLIFFSIFPYRDLDNQNLLNPQSILNGFSNTSLITVISLLILGQGVVNTRVLDGFISNFSSCLIILEISVGLTDPYNSLFSVESFFI